jgi:HEAT repeat protein
MRWSRETAEFHARVPLEEEVLLALGRTGEPAAIEALAGFLENRQNDLRPFACLALGATGERAAAVHAAPFLMDPDPFTRWCAYLALSHLLDIEVPIDWMQAPEAERHAASQRIWKRLLEPGPEPTLEPETGGDR